MPLKRTPPSTPITDKLENTATKCSRKSVSGSSPDLSGIGQDSNVTLRQKAKRKDCDCLSRLDEIRAMLSAYTAQSDHKFSALQTAISEIIAQNDEIKESINFISKEYDDIKIKLAEMETERATDRRYIRDLEGKVEYMEQQLFSTKIEIRNVPQTKEESKKDLCDIVVKTADVIGYPIKSSEIKDVYRVKTKNNSTTINVDFLSAMTKDTIVKKVRKFNNLNKPDRLNTTHLKLDGPVKPIYLSEKLTPKMQRLYFLARTFASSKNYKYCWTSYGKVLMRKADGERYIIITNEAELDNLGKHI